MSQHSHKPCFHQDTMMYWYTLTEEQGEEQDESRRARILRNTSRDVSPKSLVRYSRSRISRSLVYHKEEWDFTPRARWYTDSGKCLFAPNDSLMVRLPLHHRQDQDRATPTFHRFRDLPVELRRKIWAYALPDPRSLLLSIPDSYSLNNSNSGNDSGLQIFNDCNDEDGNQLQELVLTLKLTCRESCEVFDEHYVRTPFELERKRDVLKAQDDDPSNNKHAHTLTDASNSGGLSDGPNDMIGEERDDDELSDMENEANSNNKPSSDIALDYDEECNDLDRRYPHHTYVDLTRDTLRVDVVSMSALFKDISQLKLGLIHLRHIAIEYRHIAYEGALAIWSYIARLPCVKTLTIVLGGWQDYDAWTYNDILFEIKEDFTYMLPETSAPYWGNSLTPTQRTRQLTMYAELANTIKQEFRALCSGGFPEHLRDLEVKVAMHGRIFGPCPALGPTKALFLTPRQPKYSGVAFWAEELTLETFDQTYHHRIYIGELDCEAPCTCDGTLITSYDENNPIEDLMEGRLLGERPVVYPRPYTGY
ncbi:hypothetical protein BDZ45DRAFT_807107 [Acephala macrosclerotiorum]|nr:hypothetical protein BDZ45DRAFT_807107 [Acephala macrosclerotiorum]